MYQERHKTYKSFDPVIPFLGIYPKEIILNKDEGLCTKVFNIISFIIGKNWKELNCPISRVRVRIRVGVVIKPITLSRYPLARKGILFGGPDMEKSLDTRRR